MKSYLDLIPISARVHKKQNRMTLFCITLAVFLVTVIFGMADMEIRSQRLQAIKDSGNWHAVFTGISDQEAKMIAARPEVKAAGQYAVLNFNGNDDYFLNGKSAVICGMDESTLTNIFPYMKISEGRYPSQNNEVALTENVKSTLGISTGDTIKLDTPGGTPLKFIVTGFSDNSSRLMKEDAYGLILTTRGFRSAFPPEQYTNQLFVQLSTFCNMQGVIADIAEQYQLAEDQIGKNLKLMAAAGQSRNSFILQLYSVAFVLFLVVLLAGVLMIASSLNSNVMQRTEFFGMMRCLGATKRQVMRFVRREGLQWCKTAIPLGLGTGVVVVWVLCATLKFLSPHYFAEMPAFGISWLSIICGTAVGILTVLLAARAPAQKAARVSPLAAVSGNVHFVQPFRTPANTQLFKVDTALGIHHAKASRKNFFLMVGSFSLSIILFLCFSTAVDFMHHAIVPLRPWTPDLSIVSADNTCSIEHNLAEKLQDNPNVNRVYGRMFAYGVPAGITGQEKKVNLISYEGHQFSWAKDFLIEGSVDEVQHNDNQVLVVYNAKSSLHPGDTLTLNLKDGQKEVTVAGILSTSPFDSRKGVETVICSEKTFQQLTGKTGYTILDIQLSNNTTGEDVNEIRALAGPDTTFSDRRLANKEARGAYYSFALFIYGFLVIIALITIFNIVNSVAMSVSARTRQYGIMRAVGMSSRQLVKMITAEAGTYAFVGSITGCITGLPLHKLLFTRLVTYRWGEPWQVPFDALGIMVAIVILSTIFAVRGPAKRIHNMSIVDTINAQ